MEPQSHESFQFGDSEERRRRRRQERERFLGKLRRWREERKASRSGVSAENATTTSASPESTPPPERRKKRLRRAALKFMGISEPRPRAQPASSAEVTTLHPEIAKKIEQPSLVLRASRHLLSFMGREEGRVRAATADQLQAPQTKAPDGNVIELSAARARLANAADRLHTEITSTQHSPAQEAKILPFPARNEAQPPTAEPEQQDADYVENPTARLVMTPLAETVATAVARRGAETMSYKERLERRRGARLGTAVTVLAITTGLALRSRRRWKHEAQSQQKKSQELATLAAARQEQLRRNADEIARLERERVNMHSVTERSQRVKEVVEVAAAQTELTYQTANALRRPTLATRERQPAPPRIEHVPLPVSISTGERPVATNPEVHAPAPLSTAEQYNLSQLRSERAPLRQPTAELTPDSQRFSKEGPTEQELTDRVERDPGRRGLVTPAGSQDEQQQEVVAPTTPTQSHLPSTPYAQLPNAWRDPASLHPQQSRRGWLMVAIVIILLIGVALLSFTL
ncbi:MAG TPA: hypothetical protein VLF60_00330 [Candidatus Saccharimonadales bacterium]|nr:hypothetical protein [Candidatus Saccharimonadales bacterium]